MDPNPTEAMLAQVLGIGGEAEAPQDEAQPGAADATATSTEAATDEGVEPTLDELLAELDGQTAPHDETAAPATEPETAAAPDEIAELQRQLDEYKAKEAAAEAEKADGAVLAKWDAHLSNGYAWYDAMRSRIQAAGMEQGRSQDEIDLAIYRRVVQGIGLTDPTTGAPVMGEQQWEEETRANQLADITAHYQRRSAPSHFDQMVATYGLDEADKTALAKFVNYPPDAVEEIARTLGAKNQRLTTTQQQAVTDARRNVQMHLAQGNATTPGAPGARPPRKPYQFQHTPDKRAQETELVARALGLR